MLIFNICKFLVLFLNISSIFYIFAGDNTKNMADKKQERAVVHLEMDGKHYYYGNLKALCDNWSKDEIGVAYNYLKNYNLSPEKPYIGKRCIVRKGIIITSPHKNEPVGESTPESPADGKSIIRIKPVRL